MSAVAGDAIDLLHPLDAKLHPAGCAMRADAAAAVMMLHDAHADPRLLVAHPRPHRRDDAARLVPGDDRPGAAEPQRRRRAALGPAVEFEIAAAHARGLDLDDDLARSRRRVREVLQLERALAEKDDALHAIPP